MVASSAGSISVQRLPDREPADGVAVEVQGHGPLGALGPQVDVDAALHDAEQALVVDPACGPTRARAAQAAVRSTASRTTCGVDGSGGQTSSTIWMSAPSASWTATAGSGVKRTRSPS